jgi:hypothetical protein
VRTLPVIAVNATDTVGPTRLRLLTAGSSKLPVVVVADVDGALAYYVFDVATLQTAMTNQLSRTPLTEALDTGALVARAPVTKAAERTAEAGSPVVENGRLIGVIAEDEPERKEPGEADMNRGAPSGSAESTPKRGLWKRLSRSDD